MPYEQTPEPENIDALVTNLMQNAWTKELADDLDECDVYALQTSIKRKMRSQRFLANHTQLFFVAKNTVYRCTSKESGEVRISDISIMRASQKERSKFILDLSKKNWGKSIYSKSVEDFLSQNNRLFTYKMNCTKLVAGVRRLFDELLNKKKS